MRGGALVREARERSGFTQAALAARVGTTQSAIARIEGGAEPTLPRLRALLDACGVEMRIHLARFDGDPAPSITPAWSPTEPVRTLARLGVPFVLAGRAAAAMWSVPVAVDVPLVVPDGGGEAIASLAEALDELQARRRIDGDASLPFDRSASGLRARRRWELATTSGSLDVDLEPEGTRGFVDLVRRAEEREGLLVAAPADIARQLDAGGDDLAVVTRLRNLADRPPG